MSIKLVYSGSLSKKEIIAQASSEFEPKKKPKEEFQAYLIPLVKEYRAKRLRRDGKKIKNNNE